MLQACVNIILNAFISIVNLNSVSHESEQTHKKINTTLTYTFRFLHQYLAEAPFL